MKTLRPVSVGFAGGVLMCAAALGQDLDLNGYWESDAEGTVRIQHDTATGAVFIEGSPCPNGAWRPYILSGDLEGNILTGTMVRCTNQELIDECGHPQIYNVSFSASVSLNTDPMSILRGGEIEFVVLSINARWLMEYYIVEDCKEKRQEERAGAIVKSCGWAASGGGFLGFDSVDELGSLNDVG